MSARSCILGIATSILVGLGVLLSPPPPASAATTDFISEWRTTSPSETITLPLYNGGSYNFTVDWGDGSSDTILTWNDPKTSHTYQNAGTYTVTVSGQLAGWSFNDGGDRLKIFGITQWGTFNPGDRSGAFRGCENLNITATDAPDLTGVTTLKEMFNNAKSLTTPSFSAWDTSGVREMDGMFRGAEAFNGVISSWNTLAVTTMREMFADAKAFNQGISAGPNGVWDTRNVREMDGMFRGAEAFNGDITGWNTSSVTTMREMFADAKAFNRNIGGWNTATVSGNGMEGMFRGATVFNGDIGNWDTADVTTMREMFADARAFNRNIGSWNTGSVTNMEGMFRGTTVFNGDIAGWDTADVTTMREMFTDARAFNRNIGSWNTGSVRDMEGMFRWADSFNQPVGTWNTTNVTTMREMFTDAKAFNQNVGSWSTGSVTNMEGMFRGATVFNGDIGSWDTADVTTMREMFTDARAFNRNIGGWNTATVSGNGVEGMFRGATVFNGDIGSWDTADVTTMREMFADAKAFNQNISSWNTGSVMDMEGMFRWADSFNQPVGTWNTTNVTTMREMFTEAKAFNQNIGSWNTGSVTDMEGMFRWAEEMNQNLGALNVSGVTSNMGEWLYGSAMTPVNMDLTLQGWASRSVNSGVSLDLGFDNGSPGNSDNMFYTQGIGDVAIAALRARGWTITGGNFISTAHSLPDPSAVTMNPGATRTFDVRLYASSTHSYNYDSRSVLTATPTLGGSSAGAVTYDSIGNDGDYEFTYVASSTNGPYPLDDTITITVNGQTILTSIRITINLAAPAAPTIASATPGNASATVAFSPPSSDGGSPISGYEYSLDSGQTWTSAGQTSPFTIPGLVNGQTYDVQLRAVNSVGPGPASTPASVTPASIPPLPPPVFPPSAPRDVTGVAGDGSVAVSWRPPADAGSFPVTDYRVTAGPGGQSCVVNAPALTCTVTGLTNGTAYTFVVTALNGAGWGASSATSDAVTPSPACTPALTLAKGTRQPDGRHDRIRTGGTSACLVEGTRLTPWIRYGDTGAFKEGVASIVVGPQGAYRWTREIRKDKKFTAYVAYEDLESNRVIWTRVK